MYCKEFKRISRIQPRNAGSDKDIFFDRNMLYAVSQLLTALEEKQCTHVHLTCIMIDSSVLRLGQLDRIWTLLVSAVKPKKIQCKDK